MESSQPQRRASRADFQHAVWDAPLALDPTQVPAGMRAVRRGPTTLLKLARRSLGEWMRALPETVLFAMRWVREGGAGVPSGEITGSHEELAALPPAQRFAMARSWLRKTDSLDRWDEGRAAFTALLGGLGGQMWKTPEGRGWLARAGSPQGHGIEAMGTRISMTAFFRRLDWEKAVRMIRSDPDVEPAWLEFFAHVIATKWEQAGFAIPQKGGAPARALTEAAARDAELAAGRYRGAEGRDILYPEAWLRKEWADWTLDQAVPLLKHPGLPSAAWTQMLEVLVDASVAITVAEDESVNPPKRARPMCRGRDAWVALMADYPRRAIEVLQYAPRASWPANLTPRDFKPLLTSADREVRLAGARLASHLSSPLSRVDLPAPVPAQELGPGGLNGELVPELLPDRGSERGSSVSGSAPHGVPERSDATRDAEGPPLRSQQPAVSPVRVGTPRRTR